MTWLARLVMMGPEYKGWRHAEGEDRPLIVDEWVRQSTAFLCLANRGSDDDDDAEFVPRATTFFVAKGYPVGNGGEGSTVYAVTAKHCVVKAEEAKRDLRIRVNGRQGDAIRHIRVRNAKWFVHDTSDVALARVPFDESWGNAYLEHNYHFPDDKYLSELVHVGSKVFFVGLFTPRPGRDGPLPVARFGNIALLPYEPINAQSGDFPAYLVEARSWGGQSGSPAIVYRQDDDRPGNTNRPGGSLSGFGKLLGVVSGHFDVPIVPVPVIGNTQRSWDYIGESDLAGMASRANAGMALVCPSSDIADLLNRDDVMEDREKEQARTCQRQ